jgi:hypothetical protein
MSGWRKVVPSKDVAQYLVAHGTTCIECMVMVLDATSSPSVTLAPLGALHENFEASGGTRQCHHLQRSSGKAKEVYH